MKKVDDNFIIISNETYNYDELLTKLAGLSIKDVTDILLESQIKLPRKLNSKALRLALNDKIIIAKQLNLSDEELFRLRFYPFFNEFQLQKLFATLFDDEMYLKYRKSLFELILQNNEYLRLEDSVVLKLLNISNTNEDFETYQTILNTFSFDFDGYLDSIKLEDYDENVLKSLTTDDIRQLGNKYGVVIPKRLRKEELVQYVKEVMESNGLAIPESVNLDTQSIMMVQRFAKKNNIKISADLKKDESILYLFHQISKLDLEYRKEVLLNLYTGDSFVFDLAYVTKVEEKEPEEEVIVEPVIEEVIAPESQGEIEIIEEHEEQKEESSDKPQEETVCDESPKEETITKVVETRVEPLVDAKELVDIISKSVKEIVVDVVKEIVPLFVDKRDEQVIDPVVEEKVDNVYKYDNFSNQLNPQYDDEIHNYIKNYDCKQINPQYEEIKIESDKFVMKDLAEGDIVAPEVSEATQDETLLDNLTEEEKAQIKKENKEKKRQAKLDNKAKLKEDKEKMKAMSIEEKAKLKEEKKIEKAELKAENKAKKKEAKIEAKQAKIEQKNKEKEEREIAKVEAKEAKEQEKLKLKEEKREEKLQLKSSKKAQKQADKENAKLEKRKAKEEYKDNKRALKEQEKQAKIDSKEQEAENARKYEEMDKILQGKGDFSKVDQEFFTKYMQFKQYQILAAQQNEHENYKHKERTSRIFKILFTIILLVGLTYVGIAVYCAFFTIPQAGQFYEYLKQNPFLGKIFIPFVEWLKSLIK